MNKTTILLADDHAIVRMGLKSLLGLEQDMTVVGEAEDGAAAIAAARRLKPDVVIMDLVMPKADGAEATRTIRETLPDARVVILTTFANGDGLARALEAGASGALLKTTADTELIPAIRAARRGERYIANDVKVLLDDEAAVPLLTEKQRDILEAMARGLSNNEIASALGISAITVKGHIKVLLQKLEAANRTEAVAIALRRGIVRSEI